MTDVPICAEATCYSICASNNSLIVSGGCSVSTKRSISKVQKFSLTDCRWVNLPDLTFPVDSHGSTYAAGKLYTIGGEYTENNETSKQYPAVNILDLASLSWAEGQSLPIAVSSPGIATMEENIYAMGGHDGKEWSCQNIKLNTQSGIITQCQSIPEGNCVDNATVIVNRQIFVLGKLLFAQYDTSEDQWTVLQKPLKPSYHPAMVLKHNCLIMLGGYENDKKDPNDVIQEYDLSTKKWSLKESKKMPLPLRDHWAFMMEIPQPK